MHEHVGILQKERRSGEWVMGYGIREHVSNDLWEV